MDTEYLRQLCLVLIKTLQGLQCERDELVRRNRTLESILADEIRISQGWMQEALQQRKENVELRQQLHAEQEPY